jgi:hypothetical protein
MITQESLHFELQPSLKRISTDECKQKEKLKRNDDKPNKND